MNTNERNGWILKAVVRKSRYINKEVKQPPRLLAALSQYIPLCLLPIGGIFLTYFFSSARWQTILVWSFYVIYGFIFLWAWMKLMLSLFSNMPSTVVKKTVYADMPVDLIGTFHIPDANIIESGPGKIIFEYTYPNGNKTIRFYEGSQILLLERAAVAKYTFEPDPRDPRDYSGTDCAITTAVTAHIPQYSNQLLPILQGFRNEWLESFRIGCWLSRLYTLWNPPIATWLPTKPRLSTFVLRVFISPCGKLLTASGGKQLLATPAKIAVMVWYAIGTLFCKAAYEIM